MAISEGEKELQDRFHRAQQRYRVPQGAREILLIRHGASMGRTIETLELGPLTVTNPPLSKEGEEQAALLGRHLAGEPIGAIFITPLQRTRQTAAPLAEALGLEPIVIPALREVHMGDWEHSFYDHAEAGHPLLKRMLAEESWEVLPGAETMASVAARAREGIEAIVAATEPGTVSAAFSHAGIIGDLCRQATASRAFAFMPPENTSVSRLVVMADGSWKLRSFNDMAHLGY